jgi:biotin synthase
MKIQSKAEVLEILKMPYEEFNNTIKQKAKEVHVNNNENSVNVTALFGYDNICRNQCAYCGMRAGNSGLKRCRIGIDDVKKTEENVKKLGLFVSLAAGEFSADKYKALENVGLDEYVLKFESSNIDMFTKIKTSTSYEKRMKCIEYIKNSKMELACGNIIGLPHQTLDQVADDIMLMKELNISWAPVIPYMPVPNTPLAKEGGRGSLETTIKEISILRIMMPKVNITAQQPGEDAKNGLADVQGNLNALRAGANMLFVDMLPKDIVKDFNEEHCSTAISFESEVFKCFKISFIR